MEPNFELETVLRHLRIQNGTIRVYSELMKQMEEEYTALQQIFTPEIFRRGLSSLPESTNFYDEYMRASAEAARQVLNEIPQTNPELFQCDQSEISCDTYNEVEINTEDDELAMNIVDEMEPEECIKIIETTDKDMSVKSIKNGPVNVVKEKAKRIKKKH
jgi:hypothetical protein